MLSSKGIEIELMMREFRTSDVIIFFYLPTNKIFTSRVCRSFGEHDKDNENSSSPELKNIPYWIVGLTELHYKSIENPM
jgi:hypothetical protein